MVNCWLNVRVCVCVCVCKRRRVKSNCGNSIRKRVGRKMVIYFCCDYECFFLGGDVWTHSCHYNEVEFWLVLECRYSRRCIFIIMKCLPSISTCRLLSVCCCVRSSHIVGLCVAICSRVWLHLVVWGHGMAVSDCLIAVRGGLRKCCP